MDVRSAILARRIREFCNACASGAPVKTVLRKADELAQVLLAPLSATIERCERLIVTAYGELNALPFAALRWHGDWLGRHRTLSFLPSASILKAVSRAPSVAPNTMLAVGNPAAMGHRPPLGDPQPLAPLLHAEAEARAIGALYGTKALIGRQASIKNVSPQLATHRQLHFATHGVLYEDAPLLSGMALAHGRVLSVLELIGRSIDVDLVTVSACKSGLGARTGGEEILGLTRGLLAAGSRSAVVSLWSVLDASTALLMVRFHQMVRDGVDAPTALRHAQTWLGAMNTDDLEEECARLRDLGPHHDVSPTPHHIHCTGRPLLWSASSDWPQRLSRVGRSAGASSRQPKSSHS